MLTSPLQWPILVAGVAGLLVFTWVAVMIGLRRDVQRLVRCGETALKVSLASMVGLLIIDFGAIYVIGRTQMTGLRFAIGMFLWMVVVLLPLVWAVRRARDRRGWLESGNPAGSTEEQDER